MFMWMTPHLPLMRGQECHGIMCGTTTATTEEGATLYFYDPDGAKLGHVTGQGNVDTDGDQFILTEAGRSVIKNVAKVQQVGVGCFTIYKLWNRKSKDFTLIGLE